MDDVAITVHEVRGTRKSFGLEAWEDPSTWASCPWVAPWNGTEFKADNDIYSVARTGQNEYTDYYRLMKPLQAQNGVYPIEIQELENEDSFTDYAALIQVDHASDVAIAPNEKGVLSAYRPSSLLAPVSAVTALGADVRATVSNADGSGYPAYSDDAVTVDFSGADFSQGALLVLKVKGFVMGNGEEKPFIGPPGVIVETRDANQQWQERGRLLPRFDYSIAAFDLSPYLTSTNSVHVRLRSVSHSVKYHEIDYVALQAGAQPAFKTTQVSPVSAHFGPTDILAKLTAADGNYVKMSSGERFLMSFPVLPLAADDVREFIFVSKGYYIPKSGSYLVYTWDGVNWVQRDCFTFPGTDALKSFDLSLFLPDPDGEYKVRLWQDYQYEGAGIDFVNMTVGSSNAPVNFAWDYRYSQSVSNEVSASDDNRDSWTGCPRDRITEFKFSPPVTNHPPVSPPSIGGFSPWIISWAYADSDADSQAEAEVQVWEGPNATGRILWNPPVIIGGTNSIPYAGPDIANGAAYVRVRTFDGKDWGFWAETILGTNSAAELSIQAYPVETNSLRVRQTGLFYQTVAVTNIGGSDVAAFSLWLAGLPADVQVRNASGFSNGVPCISYNGTLTPGQGIEFAVEYYVTNRQTIPDPIFTAAVTTPVAPATPTGVTLNVGRSMAWTNGTFLVEFATATNNSYTIQYSTDMVTWKPAVPPVAGTGQRILWIDSGPPKTDSHPASQPSRFYRVIQSTNLQAN